MDIKEQLMQSALSEQEKSDFLKILSGERLPDLYSDSVVKHAFSPDRHPERLNYLLSHIMRDPSIMVDKSAANEGLQHGRYAKKIITDIPAWLKDGRLSDLEMQAAAQEFIFNRADIYASDMLLIQYSADEDQPKSEVDYDGIRDVILVVLMRHSPHVFANAGTGQYIHKITEITTDTGIRFVPLRKLAFVQLDKALDIFLQGTPDPYGDLGLLKLLAFIADVNDNRVKEGIVSDNLLTDIRDDVARFAQGKEGQAMLLAEMLYEADLRAVKAAMKAEGRAEGKAEGRTEGRAEGRAESKAESIMQLAEYFMKHDSSLSRMDAEQLARSILK